MFFACIEVTTGEGQLGCLGAPVIGALIGAIIGAALGALVRLPPTGTAPGLPRAGARVVLLIVGVIVVGNVLGKLANTYLPESPTVTSLDYSVRFVVTSGAARADITYYVAGERVLRRGVPVPWERSLTAPSRASLTVTANPSSPDYIVCRVEVDGVLWDSHVTGSGNACSASATLP